MKAIRHPFTSLAGSALIVVIMALAPPSADAQVRTKKPDRGVYQSPTLSAAPKRNQADTESFGNLIRTQGDISLRNAPERNRQRSAGSEKQNAKWGAPLVDAALTDAKQTTREAAARRKSPRQLSPQRKPASTPPAEFAQPATSPGKPARVIKAEPIQITPPHRPQQVGEQIVITGGEEWVVEEHAAYDPVHAPVIDSTCDCAECMSSCDGGCDSYGYQNCNSWINASNAYLSLAPDRWFGSAELLMMWRKGDFIPPLLTTGDSTRVDPDDGVVSNEDRAGQLDQDDTRTIAGAENILRNVTAGGRLMIGTWLDCQRCRSMVARGWFAGEKRYRFFTNDDQFPVLTRPFFNVSDDQDPDDDVLLIAFPSVEVTDPDNANETITIPARATGSASITGDSNVFGADISVRQLWWGKYGGTIDLLYGYQYFGMQERLTIGSSSTSLDEDFAPVGTIITVRDLFDVRNDFHGGQIGVVSNYREGCWSFRGLFKVGLGGVRRQARLFGHNTRSLDGATAVEAEGLLVRSTNRGTHVDTEFAVSPELDLTLGWQAFPLFDVTFGYHLVALTDALQVSGAIDPDLAVNLSEPPEQLQRPAPFFRYDTFYVHGIHFGIQYVY